MAAQGLPSMIQWTTNRLKAELKKLGRSLCANAETVKRAIEKKGGKVPKAWDSWSCDQQLAFMAAFGPYGIASVLAGALVGGLAHDTVNEVNRHIDRAVDAVRSISRRLQLKVPDLSVKLPKPPKVKVSVKVPKVRLGAFGGIALSSLGECRGMGRFRSRSLEVIEEGCAYPKK